MEKQGNPIRHGRQFARGAFSKLYFLRRVISKTERISLSLQHRPELEGDLSTAITLDFIHVIFKIKQKFS